MQKFNKTVGKIEGCGALDRWRKCVFAKIVIMNKFLIKIYCNLKNYSGKTEGLGIQNVKNE